MYVTRRMSNRSHKIRLVPNKEQEVLLRKTVGATRFAYNWGLDKWSELYKKGEKVSPYILSNIWTKERPEWSREVSTCPPRHAFMNLGGAFKAFFKKQAKFPKYHKKGRKDSFYLTNDKAHLSGSKLFIQRIGWIKLREPLRYSSCKINSYVVSCKCGEWYVSVQCEGVDDVRTDSTSLVGVDVGCKNLVTTSDGQVLKSPGQIKDLERRLKRKQRLLERKKKGSSNKRKAYEKVAKLYHRIDNIKKDAIHKFTSMITKNHGIVVVEDLNVEQMREKGVKSTRKGIQNSMMSEILRQFSYKANTVIKVDRYYPSSKRCSTCGNVKASLSLSDRTYHCEKCGSTIDRDLNASLNLLQEGLRLISLSTVGHTVKDCGDSLKDSK